MIKYKTKPQGITTKTFSVPACKNPPTRETATPRRIEAKKFDNLIFI